MAIVGGSAAAAVALGALAVVAAKDDPKAPPRAAATSTSITPVVSASAPVPTARPVTTTPRVTATPTTQAAPTTTESPTTTLPGLPSGAGNYSVTFASFTVTGGGFTTSVPDTNGPQTWTATGPCDGLGDCAITAANGTAVLATGSFGSIFSGPGATVGLVASGNNSYTSTFDVPVEACGAATINIVVTLSNGTLSGTYEAAFNGSGTCPVASVSATFSGTAA